MAKKWLKPSNGNTEKLRQFQKSHIFWHRVLQPEACTNLESVDKSCIKFLIWNYDKKGVLIYILRYIGSI